MKNDVTIYHNPACGTSRNTLALIKDAGYEPKVIEYLKAGWTRKLLEEILKKAGLKARDLLRVRGTKAEELGLTEPSSRDADILAAMVKDPILVERPIVVTMKGTALCRPADKVLALL